MGAQGTAIVNFGAFPGGFEAQVDVVGQAGLTAANLIEAWVFPVDTAEHGADEHLVETIRVIAKFKQNGEFTIYAYQASEVLLRDDGLGRYNAVVGSAGTGIANRLGPGPGDVGNIPGATAYGKDEHNTRAKIYGQFTVAWAWN